MSLGQKYLIAVAYGLGSTPSTAVQLYIPRSLFFTGKGGSVQLMAGKRKRVKILLQIVYVCRSA